VSNSKRILLVEDEPVIALSERRQLEREGYGVLHAPSGEAAVDIVDGDPGIDLVLMDINLGPGIDGTQAALAILERHDLPLLFLSSHTEKDIVDKTEAITNYGYVVKNSSPTVLFASIKMAFKLFDARRRINRLNMEAERTNEELRVSLESLQDANDALSLSEEKFSKAFHTQPDAVVLARLSDGLFMEVNDGFTAMTGYAAHEVLGLSSMSPAFGFWNTESTRERFTRPLMEHGEVDNIAGSIVRKDGSLLECRMSARLIAIHGEKCILAVAKDNSDRAEKEELFASLFRKNRAVMLLIDPETATIIDANDAALSYYGYERLVQRPISEINVSSLDILYSDMGRAVEGSQSRFEFRHRLSSGELRDVEIYASPIQYGGRKLLHSLVLDITDRKRAETALGAEAGGELDRERFRFAMEATSDGVWDCDLVSGKTYYSPAYSSMLGYAEGEIPDRLDCWAALVHPEDREAAVRANQDCFENRVPGFDIEFRMRMKDGSWKWINSRGRAVARAADGRATRMIGTHVDISERKVRDGRIQQFINERETFIREVHHRVKNNMYAVSSLLEFHAQSQEDPALGAKLLDASSRVKSMGRLYEKVYRSKDVDSQGTRGFLSDLVAEAVETFPRRSRIAIATDIEDIQLGPRLLTPLGILIYELVSNSMKYAFEGREAGTISLSFGRAGTGLVLEYSDDGIGLPESISATSSPGFGMTLVRSLVEQLGASLSISRQGGTTFRIAFEAG